MVSNKLIVAAFANLALLASVNAGPCKPQSIATSATETASVTFASDTTTALSTTIETSTAVTATETIPETETTTTLTEDGTTMSASVSEASTSIAISESTAVASSSDTTVVTSSDATTAPTTTDGTTTVAETATTTTTAEGEPTELLINGNFDLGTVDPWLSDNGPIQLGSSSPYQGPAYALLQFDVSEENESVNNGVYQKIDKSLLKASTYRLSAWLLVDSAADSQLNDGCNAMAVACYYGDPININPVQGGAKTVSADAADGQWAPLSVDCSLRQDKLDQYGYLSVYIGFSCAATQAAVDAVTFEEVIL
ncbi:hypothetical protein FNAPI_2606 [Fusarium napiforme]|uniref:CBM-cenC domain-containing protein n=1 Tax=Fusarium napiforme TaxID=42672 RepID=A0A8H5JX49_9HYPO|nr:hypothetical protein FNAPI_2606 [Fusarium napiforme]